MKHEDVYYTCDRCGEKISKLPSMVKYIKGIMRVPKTLIINKADVDGHVNPDFLKSEEINTIEIYFNYNFHDGEVHLCGKCAKDFERFMKGDNI